LGIAIVATRDRELAAGEEIGGLAEIAVRFGSASVRMTPARSMARMVACTDLMLPVSCELLSACPKAVNVFVVLKLTAARPLRPRPRGRCQAA